MGFFVFQESNKRNEIRIEACESYNDQALLRCEHTPDLPIKMKVSEGKHFYDILPFQDVFNFAISEKLHNLLITEEITGWKSFPVDIKDIKDKYYGFQVYGVAGAIEEPAESGFYTGIKFNEQTWDGSDIFIPQKSLFILCNQKVKDLFTKNKIQNIDLISSSEIELYKS